MALPLKHSRSSPQRWTPASCMQIYGMVSGWFIQESIDVSRPDILAIGSNLLTTIPSKGYDGYSFEHGTSMSTAVAAGAAAHLIRYLNSQNKTWSTAELKSALMTTAKPIPFDKMKTKRDVLAIGSGLIDVKRAEHSGLIFDIEPIDYLRYFKYMERNVGEIRS